MQSLRSTRMTTQGLPIHEVRCHRVTLCLVPQQHRRKKGTLIGLLDQSPLTGNKGATGTVEIQRYFWLRLSGFRLRYEEGNFRAVDLS